MDNTKKIMNKYGKVIVKDAKRNLKKRKKDKKSSGDLSKSLKSNSSTNTIVITGEDYAVFVDQGTKDSKGNEFLTDAVEDNIDDMIDEIIDDMVDSLTETLNKI